MNKDKKAQNLISLKLHKIESKDEPTTTQTVGESESNFRLPSVGPPNTEQSAYIATKIRKINKEALLTSK